MDKGVRINVTSVTPDSGCLDRTACPVCGSDDTGGGVEVGVVDFDKLFQNDDDTIREDVFCRTCNTEWVNHYKLSKKEVRYEGEKP